MPHPSSTKKIYTLFQLTASIKKSIESNTADNTYWIKAEISGLNFANSGHAYLDLVEQKNGDKVAVMQCTIWYNRLLYLQESLGSDFMNILKNGSEIVCEAKVSYHQVFGLKLFIHDIDLSYNIGALEKRKQQTIYFLKEEGLFDKNSRISEPLVIQHIALIASPNTAGYADFINHIVQNERLYKFNITVFPVQVQGDGAAIALKAALEKVNTKKFDAVAFIRGGGSKLDLDPYNDYDLCKAVGSLPLMVMTGIGHETDITVLDMIAKSRHKTPTALADYLLDKMAAYEQEMLTLFMSISNSATSIIQLNQIKLQQFGEIIQNYPQLLCDERRAALQIISGQIARIATGHLTQIKTKLDSIKKAILTSIDIKMKLQLQSLAMLSHSITLLNSEKTLARGFSITRQNGKTITSIKEINPDTDLDITIRDGTIASKIINIKSNG